MLIKAHIEIAAPTSVELPDGATPVEKRAWTKLRNEHAKNRARIKELRDRGVHNHVRNTPSKQELETLTRRNTVVGRNRDNMLAEVHDRIRAEQKPAKPTAKKTKPITALRQEKLICYHRTSQLKNARTMTSEGIRTGTGAMYGQGFYTTRGLGDQISQIMISTYGKYVLRCELDTRDYLDLDAHRAAVIKQLNLAGLEGLAGRLEDGVGSPPNAHAPYSSVLALWLKANHRGGWPGLMTKFKGIIYTGSRDGRCAVAWDLSTVRILATATMGNDRKKNTPFVRVVDAHAHLREDLANSDAATMITKVADGSEFRSLFKLALANPVENAKLAKALKPAQLIQRLKLPKYSASSPGEAALNTALSIITSLRLYQTDKPGPLGNLIREAIKPYITPLLDWWVDAEVKRSNDRKSDRSVYRSAGVGGNVMVPHVPGSSGFRWKGILTDLFQPSSGVNGMVVNASLNAWKDGGWREGLLAKWQAKYPDADLRYIRNLLEGKALTA